jgi:hypothetical protein
MKIKKIEKNSNHLYPRLKEIKNKALLKYKQILEDTKQENNIKR